MCVLHFFDSSQWRGIKNISADCEFNNSDDDASLDFVIVLSISSDSSIF